MSTELELVNQAVADFDAVAAGIQALRERFAGVVYEVRTTQGMTEAREARAAIREPRYAIENTRKAAKAPILALGKKLDSRAAEITTQLLALEEPIDRQIKAEEARKEADRQAKIQAELKRVGEIHQRIDQIRRPVEYAMNLSSQLIQEQIVQVEALVVDESFAEFRMQAEEAKLTTLIALKGMRAKREEHEAEQAKLKAEREELARLRQEQQKREEEENRRLRQERAALEEEQAKQRRTQAELEQQQRGLQAQQTRQVVEQKVTAVEVAEAQQVASIRERFGAICWELAGQRLNDRSLSDRFLAAFERESLALVKVKRP